MVDDLGKRGGAWAALLPWQPGKISRTPPFRSLERLLSTGIEGAPHLVFRYVHRRHTASDYLIRKGSNILYRRGIYNFMTTYNKICIIQQS